ncbi:hypothetical protein J2W17_000011 [Pseudomonas lini]|jgi:hypothetical protein|nr:hypothetical protein [Pseudomonas lini]
MKALVVLGPTIENGLYFKDECPSVPVSMASCHVVVMQWNRIGRHSNRNAGVGFGSLLPAASVQVVHRRTLNQQTRPKG